MSDSSDKSHYSVKDVMKLTGLRRSRVCGLMSEIGVAKIRNKYHATKEQVNAIVNRPNQQFRLPDPDLEE
jgi:hypothetical protein